MLSLRRPTRRLRIACAVAPLLCSAAAGAQSAPRVTSDTLRLSLVDAVSIALRQSDEVALSAAQNDVTDAQYSAARANVLPQLRLNTSYLHVYESARGQAVGSVFNQPNTYTGTLNLSQTVFQGGKLVSALHAADASRQASRFDEREQRAQLSVQVERAYLQALYTERIAELQERNLALATSRLQQVEQFEKAGRAARYDVLRSRVERSNIEPQAIQARNDREIAMLELRRILNVPVAQPVSLATRIDSTAAVELLAAISDTTSAVERGAIRSAELNLESKRLGIMVARADFYPTVSVFYQSGYSAFPLIGQGFPTGTGSLSNSFCNPGASTTAVCQNGGFFSDRQLGVNVSMPLFDGLRVKSNLELAQAQERLAEIQLRQQRENVSLDVERARAELRRASAVFAARRQNSAEADEAFRLATLRFTRGLSTQLEVSDAQIALLTAQSTEARATYDLFLASADLARALGRPLPVPTSTSSVR